MTRLAPTPSSGVRRSRGAKASGLPARLSQFEDAATSWIASAPRAGAVTGGSPNSGVDSVKPSRPPLSSPGRRFFSSVAISDRKAGDSRAMSRIGPPGTLSAPARTRWSTPIEHRAVDAAEALRVVDDAVAAQVLAAVAVDVDAAADRPHQRHVVRRGLPEPVAQRDARQRARRAERPHALLVGDRLVAVEVAPAAEAREAHGARRDRLVHRGLAARAERVADRVDGHRRDAALGVAVGGQEDVVLGAGDARAEDGHGPAAGGLGPRRARPA